MRRDREIEWRDAVRDTNKFWRQVLVPRFSAVELTFHLWPTRLASHLAGKMFYLILYIAGALVVLSLLVVCVFAVYLAHKRRKFAHIPSPPISR